MNGLDFVVCFIEYFCNGWVSWLVLFISCDCYSSDDLFCNNYCELLFVSF